MDRDFYRELLNAMTDGVYFMDLDRRVTYWNKGAERLSGYAAEEVLGRSCSDNILKHVDDEGNSLCLAGCPMQATMDDGIVREADVYMHHRFGHRVPVHVRSSPMRSQSGEIIGAVEVFTDNSKNLDVLGEIERLRQEVLTDELTKVGNRRFAEITMQNLDESMRDSGVPFGIAFVDIDHFKNVNDTYGHAVGDAVLVMVAQTLKAALRPLDVACRWGGEEFVLLVPNVDQKGLSIMLERLRMLVESAWIDHEGERLQVTASFGGAISHRDEPSAKVVERADAAMYESKQAGRNRVTLAN